MRLKRPTWMPPAKAGAAVRLRNAFMDRLEMEAEPAPVRASDGRDLPAVLQTWSLPYFCSMIARPLARIASGGEVSRDAVRRAALGAVDEGDARV